MEHIDIEVSDSVGAILIVTEDGKLIEMQVPPRRDSIVRALASRPRAAIAISGCGATEGLAETLEQLGHEVSLNLLFETG
jgi:hypothetical protein